MLTARARREGRDLIIIGLSWENLHRLRQGQPIQLEASRCAALPDGFDVLIMAGETEEQIAEDLQKAGPGGTPNRHTPHPPAPAAGARVRCEKCGDEFIRPSAGILMEWYRARPDMSYRHDHCPKCNGVGTPEERDQCG